MGIEQVAFPAQWLLLTVLSRSGVDLLSLRVRDVSVPLCISPCFGSSFVDDFDGKRFQVQVVLLVFCKVNLRMLDVKWVINISDSLPKKD